MVWIILSRKTWRTTGQRDKRNGTELEMVRNIPPTVCYSPRTRQRAIMTGPPSASDAYEPLIPSEVRWQTSASEYLSTRESIIRRAMKNNTGLLLVVASQLFFSMMGASVKQISNVDRSISVLQVGSCVRKQVISHNTQS